MMRTENQYRTHRTVDLGEQHIGQTVRVAGWVANIRDHGGVMFLDLRDHYGEVQVVVHDENLLENVHKECSVSVSGEVIRRDEDTVNEKIATGTIEVAAQTVTVLGKAPQMLPFEVQTSRETKEDVRLTYRFLDLRNPKVHQNMVMRSAVIAYLR